jgi:hypothetical protein
MHPGAVEMCNGMDDDCDTRLDEGAGTVQYRDADGDLFGAGPPTTSCIALAGYVTNATDCDDTQTAVHPGGEQRCEAGTDGDCDGELPGSDGDPDARTWCLTRPHTRGSDSTVQCYGWGSSVNCTGNVYCDTGSGYPSPSYGNCDGTTGYLDENGCESPFGTDRNCTACHYSCGYWGCDNNPCSAHGTTCMWSPGTNRYMCQ